MKIANSTLLIAGANPGIGAALVEEALRRGAARIRAGTRGPLRHCRARVTPIALDVTSETDIARGPRDPGAPRGRDAGTEATNSSPSPGGSNNFVRPAASRRAVTTSERPGDGTDRSVGVRRFRQLRRRI